MITSDEPRVAPTGRYSINDTCRALGIHRNSLRRYTEEGLIKCGFHRCGRKKFYQGTEILRFWRATA